MLPSQFYYPIKARFLIVKDVFSPQGEPLPYYVSPFQVNLIAQFLEMFL